MKRKKKGNKQKLEDKRQKCKIHNDAVNPACMKMNRSVRPIQSFRIDYRCLTPLLNQHLIFCPYVVCRHGMRTRRFLSCKTNKIYVCRSSSRTTTRSNLIYKLLLHSFLFQRMFLSFHFVLLFSWSLCYFQEWLASYGLLFTHD